MTEVQSESKKHIVNIDPGKCCLIVIMNPFNAYEKFQQIFLKLNFMIEKKKVFKWKSCKHLIKAYSPNFPFPYILAVCIIYAIKVIYGVGKEQHKQKKWNFSSTTVLSAQAAH